MLVHDENHQYPMSGMTEDSELWKSEARNIFEYKLHLYEEPDNYWTCNINKTNGRG